MHKKNVAKSLRNITLIGFVFLFSTVSLSFAQWEPDVRLTDDGNSSYTSYNNAWCIAASGDTLHVVWHDDRDTNDEIYYKRSTDAGTTWETDTRLTDEPNWSNVPSVAVLGEKVHVVWEDERDGNLEVYYKRSTDGGTSWETDFRLTDNIEPQGQPSIAVSGSYVHVVWGDFLMGGSGIYYRRSTDEGATWETEVQICNAPGFSFGSSVAVSGSNVHVVWGDSRHGFTNNEIYYRRSTDGGVNWGPETRLTDDDNFSDGPSVAVSGDNVHVAWQDNRDANEEIYYKRSIDGGTNWGTDTRLTDDPNGSWFPSVAVAGTNVHVVWQEDRDGNEEIYYKRSTDGGTTWETDTRLTDDPNGSQYPSTAVAGTNVHVVWQDDRDGNWEIYYKRNPTGNPGIEESFSVVPGINGYLKAYPNPMRGSGVIKYEMPDKRDVSLRICDVSGRIVKTFFEGERLPGTYSVRWDGGDDYGRLLPSGIYICMLESDGDRKTEKILLVR
ncbi:MAG: exo-alpha-sialidase [candidate division WOR-3 bacterium]|nr:MAG: exo-alpha-sialidase [candidate division WOR-3 bacterium]